MTLITLIPPALVLAAMATACGTQPGPGPSLVPPRAAPPAPDPIRLQGRVIEETNRVVAGAKVSFFGSTGVPVDPIVADADGRFAARVDGFLRGVRVYLEHEGYEPSTLILSWPDAGPGDTVDRDLRLYAIRRITAGESLQITFAPGDPYCWTNFDDEGTCRRFRVVAPDAGLLTIRVEPPFWIAVNGAPAGTWPVAAGAESAVDVLLNGPPPGTAVVETSFERR